MTVLWWLIVGHFVADYTLQMDFVAQNKSPWNAPGIWMWVLTAHAATHGAAVALATGSVLLGTLEILAHWVIDLVKCAGWTGIHVDQALHLACKVGWLAMLRSW